MATCNSNIKMVCSCVLVKLHRLFVIVIHLLFRLANSGKREKIPQINDLILLNSASSVAAEIRKKKLKSVDVVQAYISRIQEVNSYVNAVVKLRAKEALEEAAKVDKFIESSQKSQEELERETPFLGVPFTSKEIINVRGMPITAGVVRRKGMIAEQDAQVVHLMRKAGAIPIAVTNLGELAMWPESINLVYGTTSNAYDSCRTAGGSTGGEGAILSAAGSVIGLGNDIGGSVRIPSCFNGVFGHKPTSGIVPTEGCFSFVNQELDCFLAVGPMCRYATDLLPMMKVMCGPHGDILKLNQPVQLRDLKVYYIDDTSEFNFVTKIQPDVKVAVQKAVHHFENAYKIKAQKLDFKYIQHAIPIYMAKVHEKGGLMLEPSLSSKENGSINYVWEFMLWLFGMSTHVFHILVVSLTNSLSTGRDHSLGLVAYDDTLRMFQDVLDDKAIFIYPTWPETAPHHNELLFKPLDFPPFTGLFNILQFPSTQCPMGLSGDGLPVGVQVVANRNNDRLTMAAAVELEKAFGGWVCPSTVG